MNNSDSPTEPEHSERADSGMTRRRFLQASGVLALSAAAGCQTASGAASEPIIDIHQHLHYHDRTDEVFFAHQKAMGITRTILLPAGRSVDRPSTNNGASNGLEAKCAGNEDCYLLARANRKELLFGANE